MLCLSSSIVPIHKTHVWGIIVAFFIKYALEGVSSPSESPNAPAHTNPEFQNLFLHLPTK